MNTTKRSSKTKKKRRNKQAEELAELKNVLNERNKMIADLQEKLSPRNGIAPDPYEAVTKAIGNQSPLTQNKVIEDVIIEMGVERVKEFENADANLRIATDRMEDFMKRYPGVINYRPSIKSF